MKNKILFLLFIGFFFIMKSNAQSIVITEIMYNDPSSGGTGDSLEFIEMYNNTSAPVSMGGYTLSSAVAFTFPTFTLLNGQRVIVARRSAVVQSFFNITGVFQWTTGTLPNNGGGAIVLKDSLGALVDTVRYNTAVPWPTLGNGTGSTIMLCDPNQDNNAGANWVAANGTNANVYGVINNADIIATPGTGCISSPAYHPTFVSIPYAQAFDSTWLLGDWNRDVPDYHWKNNPNTGNSSWRRNDDGAASSWTGAGTGVYAPLGAGGTAHSARFHSAAATNGTTGILSLYANFNSPGIKRLSFSYMNTSGTDSLTLLYSVDSGLTFTTVQSFITSASGLWEQKIIDLGTSTAQYVILQFKATSTGTAGGTSDIGIDAVNISIVQNNDAGIAAITQPGNVLTSVTDSVKVTLKNYGANTLTSAVINWSVNGTLQTAHPWSGSLAASGTAVNINLGQHTFTSTGLNIIKVWTVQPNGLTDPNHSNDTAYLIVYYQNYAALPYIEHFDSLWINKFGIREIPSFFWNNSPAYGNPSWRRADEGPTAGWTNPTIGAYTPTGANATSQSARFHTAGNVSGTQGSMQVFLDFSLVGNKELRFYYINTNGSDSLAIWMSTDGGATFSYLTKFTAATAWTQEVVPLGGSVSNHVVLVFRATANNNGTSDIGIDEVKVDLVQPDAGVISLVSPIANCGLTNNEVVTVKVKNFGNLLLNTVPVSYNIDGNIINETITTPMNPGDTVTYTFTAHADLSVVGPHGGKFYTSEPADANHQNDTLGQNLDHVGVINTFPHSEDFESTAFTGWRSDYIAGLNEWVLGTPAKTNLNSAHSGVNAWVTGLTGNFHNSTNSYVASPCFDLSSVNSPYVSIWLDIYTNSSSDAMVMEASWNDSTFVKVGDSLFYNNYSANLPVAPPKWALTNGGWTEYHCFLPSLAHKSKVIFRFRFQSNATNNNEGIALDDFMIRDSANSAGIANIVKEPGFMLYPNPARNMVWVNFTEQLDHAELVLVNAMSQVIESRKLSSAKLESIDISKLPAGVYGIIIKSDQNSWMKKIIKN